jgi:hypothetical protein
MRKIITYLNVFTLILIGLPVEAETSLNSDSLGFVVNVVPETCSIQLKEEGSSDNGFVSKCYSGEGSNAQECSRSGGVWISEERIISHHVNEIDRLFSSVAELWAKNHNLPSGEFSLYRVLHPFGVESERMIRVSQVFKEYLKMRADLQKEALKYSIEENSEASGLEALVVTQDLMRKQSFFSRMKALGYARMAGIDVSDISKFNEKNLAAKLNWPKYFQLKQNKLDTFPKVISELQQARSSQLSSSEFQNKFCGGASCEFKQFNVTMGGEQVSLISPILRDLSVSEENLQAAISPIVDLKAKDLKQMNKLSANIYSPEGFLTNESLSLGGVTLSRKSVESIKGSHLIQHFFKKSRKSVRKVTSITKKKSAPTLNLGGLKRKNNSLSNLINDEEKDPLGGRRPSSAKPFISTDENENKKKYLGEYRNQDDSYDYLDSESNVSICGEEDFDGDGSNFVINNFDAELMNRVISERYTDYDLRERVMGGVDAVIRYDMDRANMLDSARLESHVNFDTTSAASTVSNINSEMNSGDVTANVQAATENVSSVGARANLSGRLGSMRSMAVGKTSNSKVEMKTLKASSKNKQKVSKAASRYHQSLNGVDKFLWSKANALTDHTLSMHMIGNSNGSIEDQVFLPAIKQLSRLAVMGEYAAKYHATMAKGFELQSKCLNNKTKKVALALLSSRAKKTTVVKKTKMIVPSKSKTPPTLNVGSVKNNSIREEQIAQANTMIGLTNNLVTDHVNVADVAPDLSRAQEVAEKFLKIYSDYCTAPRGFRGGGTFRRSKKEADQINKNEISRLRDNREYNAGEMKIDVISNSVNTIKKSDGRSDKFTIDSDNKVAQLNASDFAKKLGAKFNKPKTTLASKNKELIKENNGKVPSVKQLLNRGSFRSNPNLAKSSLGALASLGVPKFAVEKANKKPELKIKKKKKKKVAYRGRRRRRTPSGSGGSSSRSSKAMSSNVLKSLEKNKNKYKVNAKDTIFQRLSKTYKRVGISRLFGEEAN